MVGAGQPPLCPHICARRQLRLVSASPGSRVPHIYRGSRGACGKHLCIQTSQAAACQDEDTWSQGQVIGMRFSSPRGSTACACRPDPSFRCAWLQGRDKTSLRATRGLEASALRFNTSPDPTVPQRCQAAGLRLRPPVCSVSILSDTATESFSSSAEPCALVPTPLLRAASHPARGQLCSKLVGILIFPAFLPHFRVRHANVLQGTAELGHSRVP